MRGGVGGRDGGLESEHKYRGRFRSRLSQTGSKPTTIFGLGMVEVVAVVLVDVVEVLVVGVGEGVVVVLVVVVCWCWVWGRCGGGVGAGGGLDDCNPKSNIVVGFDPV